MSFKHCRDCRWYKNEIGHDYAKCTHVRVTAYNCKEERNEEYRYKEYPCGKVGKMWEPKPSLKLKFKEFMKRNNIKFKW